MNKNKNTKLNRPRNEMIELIYNSSTFEKYELKKMSDNELAELWNSLEMDDWLDKIITESGGHS